MNLTCRQCGGWDEKNPKSYKNDCYYCRQRYGGADYVDLNDSRQAKKCYDNNRFILNKDRIKGFNFNSFKPWGLHLITAVAEILNLDNDATINLLLEKGIEYKGINDEFKDILFEEYDLTGKMIADKIKKSNNADEIATMIYNYYFIPMANLIKEGKSSESLVIFANLVNEFKKNYEIIGLIDLDYAIQYLEINNDELCKILYTYTNNEFDISSYNKLTSFIADSKNDKLLKIFIQTKDNLIDLIEYCDSDELREQIIKNYYFTYFKIMFKEIEIENNNTVETLTILLSNLLISINSKNIDRLKENENNKNYTRILKMSER